MSWLQLSHVNEMLNGTMHGIDVALDGVFTDTRKANPNGLFFALPGPHFDPHDLLKTACDSVAAALGEDEEVGQLRSDAAEQQRKREGVESSLSRAKEELGKLQQMQKEQEKGESDDAGLLLALAVAEAEEKTRAEEEELEEKIRSLKKQLREQRDGTGSGEGAGEEGSKVCVIQ